MDIGNKLKQRRLALGYTQQDAAEKMHVTRQTISNWENEKSYPDLQSVVRLSDIYEISLDDLLKGDGSMVEKVSEREKRKGFWIGIIPILLVFFASPLLLLGNDYGGGEIVVLGIIIPVALFLLNLVYAWLLKFTWIFPVVSAFLFIPVIFIYFNMSAIGFTFAFMVVGLIGNLLGKIINKVAKKQN